MQMNRETVVRVSTLAVVWVIGSLRSFGPDWRRLDPVQDVLVAYAVTAAVGLLLAAVLFGVEFAWFKMRGGIRRPLFRYVLLTGLTVAALPLLWFQPRIY